MTDTELEEAYRSGASENHVAGLRAVAEAAVKHKEAEDAKQDTPAS